jgi:hypothetical protein
MVTIAQWGTVAAMFCPARFPARHSIFPQVRSSKQTYSTHGMELGETLAAE